MVTQAIARAVPPRHRENTDRLSCRQRALSAVGVFLDVTNGFCAWISQLPHPIGTIRISGRASMKPRQAMCWISPR